MGGDLQLWDLNPENWHSEETGNSNKRQKTGVKVAAPTATLKNVSGVTSLLWSTNDNIVVGGQDHQLKIFDVQK